MTDSKPSAPQPPTMHTKHVAASVSDMVQEWYSGKSDVPHMTADIFERRISRFQSLEPAQPDPLGAAWMREQAAEVVWSEQDQLDANYWGTSPSEFALQKKAQAIRAIPDPTHADLLAQAMTLPEVREALATAWCNGRDAACTAAWNAKPLHILHLEAIGRLTPPAALVQP